jgi:endoribonuclease Dicer
MSSARSRAVCSPALAWIAVNRLGLHKTILVNSVELSIALSKYVPVLEGLSATDVIAQGWKHDPPKALSDVFESTLGAVLLDSGYNYEKTEAVVEWVMGDILDGLTLDLPPDPISQLMILTARAGCQDVSYGYVGIDLPSWVKSYALLKSRQEIEECPRCQSERCGLSACSWHPR